MKAQDVEHGLRAVFEALSRARFRVDVKETLDAQTCPASVEYRGVRVTMEIGDHLLVKQVLVEYRMAGERCWHALEPAPVDALVRGIVQSMIEEVLKLTSGWAAKKEAPK